MYFVVLILLVSVSARDISQSFDYEQRQERFERPNVNPPTGPNYRNRHGIPNYNRPNGELNLNQHEQSYTNSDVRRWNAEPNGDFNNQRQFHETNNREYIPSDRNYRIRNMNPNQGTPYGQFEPNNREFITNDRNDTGFNMNANAGQSNVNLNGHAHYNEQNNRGLSNNGYGNINYNSQGRSHDNTGSMDINMAFDRQNNQNRREQSNLNMPRQSFNINNEYSNRDSTKNRSRNSNRDVKYNQEILNARRRHDEVTMEDYNRDSQTNHRSYPENQSNSGIVSFVNNLSNNTNQTRNHNLNKNRRTSGFRQTDERPKTAIENEVTEISLGSEDKENLNMNKGEWVWGIEGTTTISPVTLDDRAAFSGDHCPTGYARFKGMCVPQD